MPALYKVVCAEVVLREFEELHHRAAWLGVDKAFLHAAKRIMEKLQSEPMVLGEPLYRLPNLDLVVCVGGVPPLLVYFAVNEARRFVIVQRFKLFLRNDGNSTNGALH
jgi:hypothetical protein